MLKMIVVLQTTNSEFQKICSFSHVFLKICTRYLEIRTRQFLPSVTVMKLFAASKKSVCVGARQGKWPQGANWLETNWYVDRLQDMVT